jgi:Swt1-like HEPN
LIDDKKDLRDWLFRSLMFEAEAEKFRQAGIRIGADLTDIESTLTEQTLAPFSMDLRNQALQMARIYSLMYCFENSVRTLIRERLSEKYGADWWNNSVPNKIHSIAESRYKSANDNSWLEGQRYDLLSFVEFGHLADIIVYKWDDFSDLIPSQQWIKQRMDELEQARNYIAHNRLLLPSEFKRIEMYITDWNRVVGL